MQQIYARASRVVVWLDTPPLPPGVVDDLRFALPVLSMETLTFDTMNVFRVHFGSEREQAPYIAL